MRIETFTILQEGEKDVPTAWIQLFDEVDVMWKAEWQQVPTQKKLDKLQTVADFERVRIGIPFEIKIGAKTLEENVLAAYNPKDRSISIGLDTLENYSGLRGIAQFNARDGACYTGCTGGTLL